MTAARKKDPYRIKGVKQFASFFGSKVEIKQVFWICGPGRQQLHQGRLRHGMTGGAEAAAQKGPMLPSRSSDQVEGTTAFEDHPAQDVSPRTKFLWTTSGRTTPSRMR